MCMYVYEYIIICIRDQSIAAALTSLQQDSPSIFPLTESSEDDAEVVVVLKSNSKVPVWMYGCTYVNKYSTIDRYVCICMYVCIYVCIHVFMYVYLFSL